MGGIAIDLLPRDSELARRAAGGDGSAFVRLYDRYASVVFETTLTATGSVEAAAEATQAGFLTLLRRPPAIDAPDQEVLERLRAMALAADVDRREPSGGGVGWLRAETVAKAGARFDADWSLHLAAAGPHGGRSAAEVAQAWRSGASAPVEQVASERPLAVPGPAPEPRPRRFRPRALLLRVRPRAAALAALPAIGITAAAIAVLSAAGDDRAAGPLGVTTLASADAVPLAPLTSIAARPARARTDGQPKPPEEASAVTHARPVGEYRPGSSAPAHSQPIDAPRRVARRPPVAGQTLGVTRQGVVPRGTRDFGAPPMPPAAEVVPTPGPATPPAQSESAPEPPAQTPAPAPTQTGSPNADGTRRNCHSKQSAEPC